MVKKVVIAGLAAATVLGAGTAALAASGSSGSASPSASSSPGPGPGNPAPGPGNAANGKARQALRRPGLALARRALHGSWVTRNGSSGFVTHDAIRGQVTAVSAGSITVKAADDVSQTYAVTGDTKVHLRGAKGKAGTIGEVKTGDRVIVLGTGTGSLTATQVLDGAV
jgi:hypothetical protein